MTRKIKSARESTPQFRKDCEQCIINNWSIKDLARKYDVNYLDLQKYLQGNGFKNIEYKWQLYRRCRICKVYRTIDNYYKWSDWYYYWACIKCETLVNRNRYKIWLNTKWDKFLEHFRQKRKKRYVWIIKNIFNLKRNTKRRVKNILLNKFRIK